MSAGEVAVDLLKGTLDVLILKTLARVGPLHGYGVSKFIRETTGEVFVVEEGAIYPALRRLEERGLLEARWDVTETARDAKFYELTREGEKELEKELRAWGAYVEAMGSVLEV